MEYSVVPVFTDDGPELSDLLKGAVELITKDSFLLHTICEGRSGASGTNNAGIEVVAYGS